MSGVLTQDQRYHDMFLRGTTRPHPFTIPRIMNSAAASHVSMRYRLQGPGLSTASACAAATHAIGEASEMIRAGRADVMLAGGADALAKLAMERLEAGRAVESLYQDICFQSHGSPFCKALT